MPAWLGWMSVVVLSLFLAVYPALAVGLAWRFGRGVVLRFGLVFAASWMLAEWLRAALFTGFSWNPLGALWLPLLPVAQAAGWIGALGLSGLAVLAAIRSEEHTSELQSLMRISYAVFCLKTKKKQQ